MEDPLACVAYRRLARVPRAGLAGRRARGRVRLAHGPKSPQPRWACLRYPAPPGSSSLTPPAWRAAPTRGARDLPDGATRATPDQLAVLSPNADRVHQCRAVRAGDTYLDARDSEVKGARE